MTWVLGTLSVSLIHERRENLEKSWRKQGRQGPSVFKQHPPGEPDSHAQSWGGQTSGILNTVSLWGDIHPSVLHSDHLPRSSVSKPCWGGAGALSAEPKHGWFSAARCTLTSLWFMMLKLNVSVLLKGNCDPVLHSRNICPGEYVKRRACQ